MKLRYVTAFCFIAFGLGLYCSPNKVSIYLPRIPEPRIVKVDYQGNEECEDTAICVVGDDAWYRANKGWNIHGIAIYTDKHLIEGNCAVSEAQIKKHTW